MTGCRYRVLPPQAFHSALRDADRELRGFSLEAAVAYWLDLYETEPEPGVRSLLARGLAEAGVE